MSKMIEHFNSGVDFDSLYAKDTAIRFCVLLALKYAKGNENRIVGKTLFPKVRGIWAYKVHSDLKPPGDRKIRETISQLRKEGALIISTGGKKGGYWIATSYKEILVFYKGELRARALDLLYTASMMLMAARRRFGGQKGLWREISMDMVALNVGIKGLED